MFGMVYSFCKTIKFIVILQLNMFISEKEDEETFRMEISGLLNEMGKYCTAEKPAVIYFYHDRLL